VKTFGENSTSLRFRGEALHSLAQLSSLEILKYRPAGRARAGALFIAPKGEAKVQVKLWRSHLARSISISGTWLEGVVEPPPAQQVSGAERQFTKVPVSSSVAWQVWQNDRRMVHPGQEQRHNNYYLKFYTTGAFGDLQQLKLKPMLT